MHAARRSASAGRAPIDYQSLRFDYRRHRRPGRRDAGAPPGRRGRRRPGRPGARDRPRAAQVPVVLLDNDNTLSTGSRAICFAKRTLEIFDRLGCGDRMVAKGVSWNVGKVFFKDEQVYRFDLLPEAGHERPAFINLQQYYVEGYLAERAARAAADRPALEQQGGRRRAARRPRAADHRDARRRLPARGRLRRRLRRLALQRCASCSARRAKGRVFRDRFLIADVTMDADLPTERRFWFDPPFHPSQSVLLHKQADDIWRVDFQLGWDADPDEERKPENIIPRVRALLDSIGHERRAVRASTGPASTPSPASAWSASATAACCSPATRRTACRPSARAAPTRACRTPTTWPGSSPPCCSGEAPDALLDSYAQRARIRGRREHPQLDARHRLHHAQERRSAGCSATRCSSWPSDHAVRARAGQQRAAVGAGDAARLAAQHARCRCLRRPHGARRAGRRCAVVRADGSAGWLLRELGHGRGFTALVFGDGEAAERSLRGAWQRPTLPLHVRARRGHRRGRAGRRALRRAARHRLPAAPRPARVRALAPADARRRARRASTARWPRPE